MTRDIHSSPATFTVGRIVNCFRARSALLVNRLEDCDDVLQKNFADDDQEETTDEVEAEADQEFVFECLQQ